MRKIIATVCTMTLLFTMLSTNAFAYGFSKKGTFDGFSDSYISKLSEELAGIEKLSADVEIDRDKAMEEISIKIVDRPIASLNVYEGDGENNIDNPKNLKNIVYKIPAGEVEWYLKNIYGFESSRTLNAATNYYYYDEYYYFKKIDSLTYENSFELVGLERFGDDLLYVTFNTTNAITAKVTKIFAVLQEKSYDNQSYFAYKDISLLEYTPQDLHEMLPDAVKVVVNKKKVLFDQMPVIKDGYTLVPIRATFEALDCEIAWDQATQKITISRLGTSVECYVGNSAFKIYHGTKLWKEDTFDVPPQIINDRTLVPIRAISEAFGCTVRWDNATRTVAITL